MAPPLDLSLTHGQVAWVLSRGLTPTAEVFDQIRNLRQLGVPFTKQELGMGRGNRIRYGVDHLIELGDALSGLRRGMTPHEDEPLLLKHRDELRQCYRDTLQQQPPAAFKAERRKS